MSKKKIAVTGVNGFVGKHLVRELHKNNISVVGVGREETTDSEISELLSDYQIVDLTKEWPELDDVDAVIHLAGLAAIGPSFEDPQNYIEVNSSMVTHMAEYYLQIEKKPRLIIVSSGAIYDSSEPMPLTEKSAVGFNSPYAVSKVLVESQCAYYRNRGLDCIVVRPFNHIGPGQLGGFLVPDTIEQLHAGGSLIVGNIATRRDYTDVRDIARAYYLLATSSGLTHTTFNACSGKSISGEEIITLLKQLAHKEDVLVEVDHSKIRPTDPDEIYGDASALKEDTGWEPIIKLQQTLQDALLAAKLD